MARSSAKRLVGLTIVFAITTAFGMVSTILSVGSGEPPLSKRLIYCLPPLLSMATAMICMVRAHAYLDELQRRIHVEALAISFAATAFLTLLYGQLEYADIGLPQLSMVFVWPVMAVLWTVSYLIVRKRYS